MYLPKVSIIVPVYNTEKYLGRCLDSLIGQDFQECEFILINDGSTDNSLSIMQSAASRDKRFVVLSKQNGGQSSARNMGMSIARGEYVMFVDSDDYLDDHAVSELLTNASDCNADICIAGLDYVGEGGEIFYKYRFSKLKPNSTNVKKDVLLSCGFMHPSVCNSLYRKRVLKGVVFPEGMYYEDLATAYRLVLNAESYYYIDKGLYKYVQRKGSTVHSFSWGKINDNLKALEMMRLELVQRGLIEEYWQQYAVCYLLHAYIGTSSYIIANEDEPFHSLNLFLKRVDYDLLNFRSLFNLYRIDKNSAIKALLLRLSPSLYIKVMRPRVVL